MTDEIKKCRFCKWWLIKYGGKGSNKGLCTNEESVNHDEVIDGNETCSEFEDYFKLY